MRKQTLSPIIRSATTPILFLFILFSCSSSSDQIDQIRPNILLLVADDLGYADLGCYGGDIETPNIDHLAQNGIRFSRFHTAPLCSPTRAMLLSGNDNHIAGIGIQGLITDQFGYEGRISDRVAIIPEVLKNAGYHTYMAGKWHLGTDSAANPVNRGFERSFVNLDGAGNHFDDQGMFEQFPKVPLMEDGQIAHWKNGSYSTDLFTDKLIEYIGSNIEDGQPFFAFGAFTAPHWPLQVHEEYWRKYEGKYDDGYEALKDKRLRSLKTAGMIPDHAVLPPNHPRVIPWDSLTSHERKRESRKMELYAGMIDNLDVNIGRLIHFLQKNGQLENTVIVFMADNGAAAEDFYYDDEYGPYIQEHFTDTAYQQMGTARSFVSYGPQWAEAGSAPFRYFKSMATEGAVVAPLIVSGPLVNNQNEIYHEFVSLLDIAPTFYELAGTRYPESLNGNELYPLRGNSMTPILKNTYQIIHDATYVFAIEHNQRIMVTKGNWKLVNEEPPFAVESFKLFNLANDLAELNDLRDQEQEKFNEMIKEWEKYLNENKVEFPILKTAD